VLVVVFGTLHLLI